ncbi:hypothetical protein DM02DRAFT_690005 [Periconia macrospinosa]|uniref:Rhodopsin domain-containing protein n=1 Tax=Periconia macrospinosa TaxID=97972 RepID=A0A2V1DBW7_9PLEO|nr:hypothetical protein DM02DRAFT_690005 [Periconia macrospinosa]
MSAAIPTVEELMALPPEYLAEDQGGKLLQTSIAFLILVPLFFGFFVTSRIVHGSKDTWDVWVLSTISVLTCVSLCILGIFLVIDAGTGRHVAYHLLTDPSKITQYLALQTAIEFIYCIAISTPKLQLLLLYLKIFRVGTHRILRWIAWATMVCVILQWLIVGVIVWASICRPLRFKWDKSINGTCADLLAAYRYVSVPNILTDLVILVLPMSTVKNLHVSTLRKIGIFLTFLTGSAGIVVSIIRFVGFYTIDLFADVTYHSTVTMLLTIAEPSVYTICSMMPYSTPLMRAMFQDSAVHRVFSKIHTSIMGSTNNKYGKRSYPTHEQSVNGYSVKATSSGPQEIPEDRVGFIELVDTIDVRSDRKPGLA